MRLREPMVLGHEVAGTIDALGERRRRLRAGERVAVNPSRPCGACRYCHAGPAEPLPRHALLRQRHAHAAYPGRLPRDRSSRRGQACKLADGMTPRRLPWPSRSRSACTPSAVPGRCSAQRVLVTGCGPIGALASWSPGAPARGRSSRPTWSRALRRRRRSAPTEVVNVAEDPEALRPIRRQGQFRRPVRSLAATAPRWPAARGRCGRAAIIVQLGLGGECHAAAEHWWSPRRSTCAAPSASTRSSPWRSRCWPGRDRSGPAADRDHAGGRCGRRLRAGGRSQPGDEGATRFLNPPP